MTIVNIKYEDTLINRLKLETSDILAFQKIVNQFMVRKTDYSEYGKKFYSAISPFGIFKSGLFNDILKYLKSNDYEVVFDEKVIDNTFPALTSYNKTLSIDDIQKLPSGPNETEFKWRELQKESIYCLLNQGRGGIVLPPGVGKTCVIIGLYWNFYKLLGNQLTQRSLIITSNTQLVNQLIEDAEDFGVYKGFFVPYTVENPSTDFTNDNKVIVTNYNFMQSKNRRQKIGKHFDSLFADEMDIINEGNKTLNIIDNMLTNFRFGCTGSLPDSDDGILELKGVIGPLHMFKTHQDIIKNTDNILANVNVRSIRLNFTRNQVGDLYYVDPSMYDQNDDSISTKRKISQDLYAREELFVYQNFDVFNQIQKIPQKHPNTNCLIIFNRTESGRKLYEFLRSYAGLLDKKIHFIDGSIKGEDRKAIIDEVKNSRNNIIVAQNKTLNRGVSIKNLKVLILFLPIAGSRNSIQSIGRVLRYLANENDGYVYDVTSNLIFSKKQYNKRLNIYADFYGIHEKDIEKIQLNV